ncbi:MULTISPECIES: T9SS type A sorting domain-containing protein [unclassified Lentimicrobium]|uniref:T9SS type A sorting domain-containing protein n=1 Tax=unclassified Lentimicrobium TaxID=2677434 RepID=UPI001556C77A|nr:MULTISPECIES: T9SS type A sorting domain-containing protein [unclassified Lentimicrobium]NPD47580.1 T9SS type A sorting domain-containing protein [Lentimicrobium sp. S6]NPD83616.1 T9SS type A sorting domain-containing protein [Lentimicrobium sp. L6]
MKKLFFLFGILFFSIPSFSQDADYTIIRSEMENYFSGNLNNNSYYSPRKMEIDHVKNLEDGKMIYSYASAYLFDQDEFNTIYPNTNIFGDSAFVDAEGNTTFYNCRDKQLTFNKYNGEAEEWIIYEEDGIKLMGSYQSPSYEEIMEGVSDRAAIIQLQVIDNDGLIIDDHYYHGKEVIISKNYGIGDHFQINEFDGLLSSHYASDFHLIGIEKGDEIMGMNNYYSDLISGLEIGNEVHSTIENSDNQIINRIKRVIQKEIGYSDFIYTFQICDYYPLEDTIISHETTETYLYLMDLRESIPALDPDDNNSYWAINYFFKNNWESTNNRYFEYQIWESEETEMINQRVVWSFDTWGPLGMGAFAKHQFIENIGSTCSYQGEYLMADEIQYYKTETEEWGIPFTLECINSTGLIENQVEPINIYPNPAEDRIEINCGETQITKVSLFNFQGKKVMERVINSQASDLSFDISNLENGVYLVEIMSQNGTISQHKIIKSKLFK